MSTDLPTALREGMRAHTADVVPPAGLLPTVRRRGARRRLRNRLMVAATPVGVAGVLVAGFLVAPGSGYTAPSPEQVAASLTENDRDLLAGPTRGDLADDEGYLAAARTAWKGSHRTSLNWDRGIFDHPVGSPAVVWAGTTPAGPAAVVAQVFDLREHDNVQLEREGPAMLWGFVGPQADGSPAVVADGYPVPGAPDLEAALIGPDRQVLLVLDRGRPADVSWGGLRYRDDATAARSWTPVTFDDGVAIFRLPAGADSRTTRLRVTGDVAETGNLSADPYDPFPPAVDTLLWGDAREQPVWPVGADPAAGWGGPLPGWESAHQALETGLRGAVPVRYPDVQTSTRSQWSIAGTTPDGRRLIAGELALDSDPGRVYVVLGEGSTVERVSRWTGRSSDPVPVTVELPDGRGWLVAARGEQLSWRTGTGGWTVAGTNAALLPAAATDVRAGDGPPVTLS